MAKMFDTGNDGFLSAASSPNRTIDTTVSIETATKTVVMGTNDIVNYKITFASTSKKAFTPGNFIAANLELNLNGSSSQVASINYKNEKILSMTVYAGIQVDSDTVYVPMGVYYPSKDGITVGDSGQVSIKGSSLPDSLSQKFYSASLTLPATVSNCMEQICTAAGLDISFAKTFQNNSVMVLETFELTTTYREALMYFAEVIGAYITMDRYGDVLVDYIYKSTATLGCNLDSSYLFSVTQQETTVKPFQFISIKANPDDIGVNIEVEGVSTGCYYEIIANPITYGHPDDFLPGLITDTSFTEFYPAKLSFQGRPDIDLGDVITYEYKGISTAFPVCSHVFEYNGGFKTTLESFGSDKKIVASTDSSIKTQITSLKQNINTISRDLIQTQSQITEIDGQVTQLATINQTVSAIQSEVNRIDGEVQEISYVKQTVDGLEIAITDIVTNGASSVQTKSGYSFTDEGLKISKSGEEMENQIDHTGVYVKRDDEIVLQANNDGVEAENVTVRTYLTVGTNSRFEDYMSNRTGCFYIGGDS